MMDDGEVRLGKKVQKINSSQVKDIPFQVSECLKIHQVPSGKHTKSYWKWQFIVDFPIQNGDFL